ncbi:hypothetical protein ACFT8P_08715 [Streptomyces sp. NPDC057101]|uniref:hypothetical protein n=1 Tax=Streptomyces sp. NPDC057101 TaxID=3346020 RepID=UPI0036450AF2
MAVLSRRHVVRAVRDGVSAMTVVQVYEESVAALPDITVTCGRLKTRMPSGYQGLCWEWPD